jgi:hypothetical protein
MQLPLIHLNGTSKKSLLEDIEEAYSALNAALSKLAQTGPNGRDYYPLPGNAFEVARQEHMARLGKLFEVKKELEELAEGIDLGGHKS